MPNTRQVLSRPPLARMTQIHQELQAGRFPNCRKIAELLECSAKTILRDIEFMRDRLDLPIAYDAQRFGFYYEAAVSGASPFPWRDHVA